MDQLGYPPRLSQVHKYRPFIVANRCAASIINIQHLLTMNFFLLAIFAAPALTQSIQNTTLHPNFNTNKCLDVRGDARADGTAVDMYVLDDLSYELCLLLISHLASTVTVHPRRTGQCSLALVLPRSSLLAVTSASTPDPTLEMASA